MRRRFYKLRTNELGTSIVEFCFVGPVMLLILAAVTQVGTVLREAQSVSYALREANRIASTASITNPDEACDYYSKAAYKAAEKIITREGALVGNWTVEAQTASAAKNLMLTGNFVTVTLTAKRAPLSFFPAAFDGVSSVKLSNTFRLYNGCA